MALVGRCLCALLLLSLSASDVYAERLGCDTTQAMRAENETDTLKTWRQIYDSFKRYSACDDGAIAEGYSDVIVKILARKWSEVPHLSILVAHDGHFRELVLRHIDATTDEKDLENVATNASKRCPRGDAKLCEDILRKAVAARSEQRKIQIDQSP